MAKRKTTDWLESYLTYTENSEPPLLYKLWVGVSVIASALQRKCHLKWDKKVYPNMYIVLVGPSGKCRKGTAMGPGQSFLRQLGVRLAAEAITREALIRELKKSSNTTINTDTNDMMFHCSLTVYSKELTVFLGYNNVNLMSDLTDWYDCDDEWTYRTKNMGTDEIIGVWVNLIGATTPELIQSTLPRDAIGGGLASRIIFVFEDKKEKMVVFPQKTVRDETLYENLYQDLEVMSGMSGEFVIDESFKKAYEPWYMSIQNKTPFEDDRFAGYFERRPTHIHKLSMILSASQGDDMVITDQHFQRALNIMEETEKKMRFSFSGMGSSRDAVITERIMRTIAGAGEITKAELLKRHYYDADKWTTDKILQTIEGMKFCRIVRSEAGEIIQYIKREERENE